jgi:hypothetical protein
LDHRILDSELNPDPQLGKMLDPDSSMQIHNPDFNTLAFHQELEYKILQV